MSGRAALLFLFLLCTTVSWAQVLVSGKVSSAEDQMPLPGVNILVKGTTVGTITEIADTRCWTLLPGHIELGLLDLPAGEHELTLLTADGRQAALGTVTVTPGRLLVIPARSLTDPPLAN